MESALCYKEAYEGDTAGWDTHCIDDRIAERKGEEEQGAEESKSLVRVSSSYHGIGVYRRN